LRVQILKIMQIHEDPPHSLIPVGTGTLISMRVKWYGTYGRYLLEDFSGILIAEGLDVDDPLRALPVHTHVENPKQIATQR